MAYAEQRKSLSQEMPASDATFSGRKVIIKTGYIVPDNSYQGSGGELLDLTAEFPGGLLGVLIEPAGGYLFEYDRTNKKVIARWCAGSGAVHSEVTGTTNVFTLAPQVFYIAIGLA